MNYIYILYSATIRCPSPSEVYHVVSPFVCLDWQYGLVLSFHSSIACIVACGHPHMSFSWVGTCCAGVVFFHIKTVLPAVVPIIVLFDWVHWHVPLCVLLCGHLVRCGDLLCILLGYVLLMASSSSMCISMHFTSSGASDILNVNQSISTSTLLMEVFVPSIVLALYLQLDLWDELLNCQSLLCLLSFVLSWCVILHVTFHDGFFCLVGFLKH